MGGSPDCLSLGRVSSSGDVHDRIWRTLLIPLIETNDLLPPFAARRTECPAHVQLTSTMIIGDAANSSKFDYIGPGFICASHREQRIHPSRAGAARGNVGYGDR